MWYNGIIEGYTYCAKRYTEPSKYGINGSRVSKLEIRRDDEIVYRYDRGLDVDAADEATRAVLAAILEKLG